MLSTHLVGRHRWCSRRGSLHGCGRGRGTRIRAGVRVWFTVVFGSQSHLGWRPSLHGDLCLGSRSGCGGGRIRGSHRNYGALLSTWTY
jgi:hypothetical protein